MSSSFVFGLYGTGGFGREMMPVARQVLHARYGAENVQLVFVDEHVRSETINGVPVVSHETFLSDRFAGAYFNIAIANAQVRQRLAETCIAQGRLPFSLYAANSLQLDPDEVGDGAVFAPFSMVTANAKIGQFFHANYYAYVAHDCVIGNYVTFAPGVQCNGNVHIGDHAYIGSGAIIRQGTPDRPLTIGAGAIVGMGAIVTKDVPAGVTVVGNPARLHSKN